MTQITRQLAVWQSPLGEVQLHLTDPYGHINGVVALSTDECRALSQVLASLQPITMVDVKAEEVTTDWEALTKAEIAATVEKRFDVDLKVDARKSVLIAAAEDLESQADDA